MIPTMEKITDPSKTNEHNGQQGMYKIIPKNAFGKYVKVKLSLCLTN
jgi:hypothetical protein